MGGQKNATSYHKQTRLISGAEIELFDLIKKRFVADLQDFGCPLSIPARLFENFTDQRTFGYEEGLLLNLS